MPASVHDYPNIDKATVDDALEMIATDDSAADNDPGQGQARLAERVVVGADTVGCLIARPDPRAQTRRSHRELLTTFAQQVSLALTDARALDALREAYHDSITGLPNRPLFRNGSSRRGKPHSQAGTTSLSCSSTSTVFKTVNDTLGHPAGDHMHEEIVNRLNRATI
jgi:GGDEF domain-containing protein